MLSRLVRKAYWTYSHEKNRRGPVFKKVNSSYIKGGSPRGSRMNNSSHYIWVWSFTTSTQLKEHLRCKTWIFLRMCGLGWSLISAKNAQFKPLGVYITEGEHYHLARMLLVCHTHSIPSHDIQSSIYTPGSFWQTGLVYSDVLGWWPNKQATKI